jgi:hypothetical protein
MTETTKILKVDVLDVPKAKTFIHEGVLYVNSNMMPPVNSQPLAASKIMIHTEPKFNNLEGETLTIDYTPASATTASQVK